MIFSVLLSKDRQTGAVGNGRLFPHFFLEAGASGIGHRASGIGHRASGIGHWALPNFGLPDIRYIRYIIRCRTSSFWSDRL
ncbi:hypothetical protein [Microcoleus sp. AT3-D2]|uniref:hypothetical protein n=1 Tax=Microcoleus sp. AT3-D2 TaxID=2818612 RepID=UPI002FD2A7D5